MPPDNQPTVDAIQLAQDLCGGCHPTIIQPNPATAVNVTAAAETYAETYQCPDPTCHPDVEIITTNSGAVCNIRIRHDDWCSELARREQFDDERR